jgi:hypothetical protein
MRTKQEPLGLKHIPILVLTHHDFIEKRFTRLPHQKCSEDLTMIELADVRNALDTSAKKLADFRRSL